MSMTALASRLAPVLGDASTLGPEEVLNFRSPVQGYLCPAEANTFGIEFQSFDVKDYDSGKTVYSVSRVSQSAA